MPASTGAVIGWLKSLGWDTTQEQGAPIVPGPFNRPMPDRLVTITALSGPGYLIDGAADASAFQARVRGPQDPEDPSEAEALAYALDALIFDAQFPAVLPDGTVLVHVHRLGSAPALFLPGPDDGDRYELTCNYVCIAGTTT